MFGFNLEQVENILDVSMSKNTDSLFFEKKGGDISLQATITEKFNSLGSL